MVQWNILTLPNTMRAPSKAELARLHKERCAVHAEPESNALFLGGTTGRDQKAAVVHAQMFPFVLTCGEQLLSIIVVSFHYVIVVASQQQHKH